MTVNQIEENTSHIVRPLPLAKATLLSSLDEDYPQIVMIQRVGIEHADGFIGFTLCAHGYKGKAIGLPTFTILANIDREDISGPRE